MNPVHTKSVYGIAYQRVTYTIETRK